MLSCLLLSVTPLSFANTISGSSTRTALKTDSRHPYLTTYFYGTNSGMIDCRTSGGYWRRYIINNQTTTVNVINSGGIAYLWFSCNAVDNDTTFVYWYSIGSTYGGFSATSWNSVNCGSSTFEVQLSSTSPELRFFNCAIENGINGGQTISNTSSVYPNAYYPIMEQASVNVDVIINNQESIASSQEENASSRQEEIIDEGSDITVSTVDDWVNGQNGLAGKLTELAATLSSNADIFSQNQVSNQENLSRAGDFVTGVFNQVPTGIVAACLCFLIILIAVKVVGR